MPDDGDDTAAALAILRGLPAKRDAEDAAERAVVPDSPQAQATRALLILEEKRPWTLEDRRAFGLPATQLSDGWHDAVRARVETLDAVFVLDAWLDLAQAGEGYRTLPVAADAFSRLTSIAPLADRVSSLLRDGSADAIRHVKEALVAAQPPIDSVLLRIVRGLLVDGSRQTATAALTIAGELARREPRAAALIAERIRADRARRRQEVMEPLSTPPRSVDQDTAARVVERSRCASLAPTAMLQLEDRVSIQWARALVAVAGDDGKAHLERMRARPGWSTLAPAPPATVDALVSPIADERRRAIDALMSAPREDHLAALLLAVELDRYVVRDVLQERWTRPLAASWLPVLAAHELARRGDRRLLDVSGDSFLDAFAATRAEHLLIELVDAGAARAPMTVPQQLTPALEELAATGAAAYAVRHIPDPRLSAEELAALDASEAQLVAEAQEL